MPKTFQETNDTLVRESGSLAEARRAATDDWAEGTPLMTALRATGRGDFPLLRDRGRSADLLLQQHTHEIIYSRMFGATKLGWLGLLHYWIGLQEEM